VASRDARLANLPAREAAYRWPARPLKVAIEWPEPDQSQANAAAEGAVHSDVYGAAVVSGVDGAVWRRWREIRPHWTHDLQLALMEHVLTESMLSKYSKEDLRAKKNRLDALKAKRH